MQDNRMKAVVYNRYGPPEVLELREITRPVQKDGEILVRVRATTVTAGDWRTRKADPVAIRLFNGLVRPKRRILGSALAGDVEAAGGAGIFRSGDRVFASTGMRLGAHAEYVSLAEDGTVAHMPAAMTYEEAAAIPYGGLTALFFLRSKAGIQAGQKVLIHGASGAVGTSAVQLAKHFGAEVTGVCGTTSVELVRSLGAHRVIDYNAEDFTEDRERYDLIFDASGKTSRARCRPLLAPRGVFVSVQSGLAGGHREDLVSLKELVDAGSLKPVIDRCYALEQIAEAHRHVERGHKKGNVVITLNHRGTSGGSPEPARDPVT